MSHRMFLPPVLGALLPALLACGASTPDPSEAAPTGGDDHGRIAGAAELSEPAVGLTSVDVAGRVRHLDLLDGTDRQVVEVDAPSGLHTDGRYLFAQGKGGVSVVDSGVWTWDHVDHFHYYRAGPRDLGTVEGDGVANVATTMSSTSGGTGVFFTGSGEVVRLDTGALSEGDLEEQFRVGAEPHAGLAVPVGDHTLVTEPGSDGSAAEVVVLDDRGDPVDGAREACRAASGTIPTRVGTVIGCDDGALLATVEEGEVRMERISYPRGTAAPAATSFANRDGRPTVAGLAGKQGIWLLDTRERSWSLLRSPHPLSQVTAVDDEDEHVLGLTTDGRLIVLDGSSGDTLATSRPLVDASLRDGPGAPTLVADQQRAYLSAPAEKRLYEIDFADGARVARTFQTPSEPAYVAGTGR